ncbi:hypothetical protein CRG98_031175 [Punica granatum]|uniref:Uncharacterized protein n=1 Tax=Punica granatum TaxID=22663 RepID=A0A2I0IXE5_PUNGR|nr:hypothetical protein CRG98_031175 [Punica granatum]
MEGLVKQAEIVAISRLGASEDDLEKIDQQRPMRRAKEREVAGRWEEFYRGNGRHFEISMGLSIHVPLPSIRVAGSLRGHRRP